MYEIFEQLLHSFGVSSYQVSKATGISQTTLSNWKKRRNKLNPEAAKKIADYFGVSLDYLMTGKEPEDVKYYINDETAAIAQKIFENKELRLLFDAASDATADDIATASNVLLALKKKERGTDDTGC